MSSPDQLRFAQEQAKLLQRLRIPSDKEAFMLSPGDLLISIDIQYQGNWGYVALDVMAWPAKSSQLYVSKEAVAVPYVPGYFAFREGPAFFRPYKNSLHNTIYSLPSSWWTGTVRHTRVGWD